MTKFVFQGTGQTVGDSGIKKIGAIALVVGAGVVAWKALGSAASALGELLVIVPLAVGSLAVGAVATYVILRARRRQPSPAGGPAAAVLWQANPLASPLPAREARAIAAAPIINVNIGSDLLATLLHAAQEQQAQSVPVIVQPECEELSR